MTDSVSWVMQRDRNRPWWEKWMRVLRLHEQLQELYAPHASDSNLDPVATVDQFFLECWSLHDWLAKDKLEAPQIDDETLGPVRANPDMKICIADANMVKHLDRKNPGDLRARIQNVRMEARSFQINIEYWNDDSSSQYSTPASVDALELATRCIDVWKRFLARHQLAPPR